MVDRLDTPRPRLVGVWYLKFLPKTHQLFLKPIYPQPDGRFSELAELFSLDEKKRVSEAAWREIAGHYEVGGQEYLVIDRYGLANALTSLEPLPMPQGDMDALQAVGTIQFPWVDRQASAESQAAFLHALCVRLGSLPLDTDPEPLIQALRPPNAYVHNDRDFADDIRLLLKSRPSCESRIQDGG